MRKCQRPGRGAIRDEARRKLDQRPGARLLLISAAGAAHYVITECPDAVRAKAQGILVLSDIPDLAHVDVRYVAELARIALTEEEARRFQAELDDILAYVAQLSELDVTDIEPMAHAIRLVNVMRADTPGETLAPAAWRANAPAVAADSCIRVPPVIEEDY